MLHAVVRPVPPPDNGPVLSRLSQHMAGDPKENGAVSLSARDRCLLSLLRRDAHERHIVPVDARAKAASVNAQILVRPQVTHGT